jgi:hypothetical protein
MVPTRRCRPFPISRVTIIGPRIGDFSQLGVLLSKSYHILDSPYHISARTSS